MTRKTADFCQIYELVLQASRSPDSAVDWADSVEANFGANGERAGQRWKVGGCEREFTDLSDSVRSTS